MTRKVMLLTGGSRGIGRAIADCAIARGWFVSLGVRDTDKDLGLDETMSEKVLYDARTGGETDWVEGVMQRHGRIDAVVACAGILRSESIVTSDDDAVLDIMTVNAFAPRRLAAAAWEPLKASGTGRVVIVSSLSGKRVKTAHAALYSFSKAASLSLAHGLRHTGWEDGIRAFALCPGFVATDMALESPDKSTPVETMTQPEDVATVTMNTIEMPNSLSQTEIVLNCQLEGNL